MKTPRFTVEGFQDLCDVFPSAAFIQTHRYFNPSEHATVRLEDLMLSLFSVGCAKREDFPENIRFSVDIPPRASVVVPAELSPAIHPVHVDNNGRRVVRGGYSTRVERLDPPEQGDYVHETPVASFSVGTSKERGAFGRPVVE